MGSSISALLIVVIVILVFLIYKEREGVTTGYPRFTCPQGSSYMPGFGCIVEANPVFVRG